MKKRKKKTNNNKKIIIFLGIVLVIAAIIGTLIFFGNKSLDKNDNDGKANEPDIELNVNQPKTLKIVDVDSKSRPYAVMINNISTARPYHSGLQEAMIVYEMIVEGGITRMMAVYKDANVDRIGSVRSSRHYFLDYALENDAIYVHIGWSPQAKSDMSSLGVNNINGLYDSAFYRDKSLKISKEHTSFTDTGRINKLISKKGYRTTTNRDLLLNYSAEDLDLSTMQGTIAANNISIKYSGSAKTEYKYDPVSKSYLRSVNGVAHKDYVTGKQYTAKNIITYQVGNTKISSDKKNRQDLDNLGKGTGYFISNGYAVPITWEKTSRDSQTVYRYNNGEEIKVNDGNTFIQIQPKSQELIIN